MHDIWVKRSFKRMCIKTSKQGMLVNPMMAARHFHYGL